MGLFKWSGRNGHLWHFALPKKFSKQKTQGWTNNPSTLRPSVTVDVVKPRTLRLVDLQWVSKRYKGIPSLDVSSRRPGLIVYTYCSFEKDTNSGHYRQTGLPGLYKHGASGWKGKGTQRIGTARGTLQTLHNTLTWPWPKAVESL